MHLKQVPKSHLIHLGIPPEAAALATRIRIRGRKRGETRQIMGTVLHKKYVDRLIFIKCSH